MSTPDFDQLRKQLIQGGAKLEKVCIRNRKVYTTAAVAKDEVIMSMPHQLLLTSDKGRETGMGKTVMEKKVNIPDKFEDQIYLALLYLWDLEIQDSKYARYYKLLPNRTDIFPIMWTNEQKEWLKGSSITASIEGLNETLEEEYKLLSHNVPEFRRISKAQYTHARLIVSSRTFQLKMDGRIVRVMSPFLDMMDHKERRICNWDFDTKTNSLVVKALENISENEEIFCHYGKKSAKKFLLFYGFSPEECLTGQFDHLNDIEFVMFLHEDFPLTKKKAALLNKEYECHKYSITISNENPNTLETLSFMRLLKAEEEDLSILPKMDEAFNLRDSPIHPLSIENELSVLEMLSDLMKQQLNGYNKYKSEEKSEPGSKRPAKRLRSSTPESVELSPRDVDIWKSARNLIEGEMQVCEYYIGLSEVVIPILEALDSNPVDLSGLAESHAKYIAYVIYHLHRQEKLPIQKCESTKSKNLSTSSRKRSRKD